MSVDFDLFQGAARSSDADVSLPFRLVLGSRSPRRRSLLTSAGYRFAVLPADDAVEEREPLDGLSPSELVDRLAFVKARDVVRRLRPLVETPSSPALPASPVFPNSPNPLKSPNSPNPSESSETAALRQEIDAIFGPSNAPFVVISCDSIAVCDGEILGKPADRADAERMLRLLSGAEHEVRTGLCLWTTPGDRVLRRVEISRLWMAPLSEERLAAYLESGLWEGKAGAFGYQDGNDWLRLTYGSESNIVGLPLAALADSLRTLAAELAPSQPR
ncbi:MAG: Maf-like protein [Thermoguttaceae bacterium]|nr:Maf-like protein [Thermoguttaceae bacterium]